MTTREERIQGLRDMADWLEAHPEVPTPTNTNIMYTFVETKDELLELMDSADGPWIKNYTGSYLEVVRAFPGIRYEINISREEVCTKKVTGTRKVEVRDPEKVKAVPMIEVDEDIVEWECHPLLAQSD